MHPVTIGAALFAAMAALLLGDYHWHLLGAIPARLLAKTAEKLGSLALLLGGAAFGAYALRLLAPSYPALLQPVLKVLRFWHPLLGGFAVALAAFHGYVLLAARAAEPLAVLSGLPLLGVVLLVAGTGWWLRAARRRRPLRKTHTYLACAALVLSLLHLALAG